MSGPLPDDLEDLLDDISLEDLPYLEDIIDEIIDDLQSQEEE